MAALLDINDSEVHLWLSFLSECNYAEHYEEYRHIITPTERERELQFRSAESRKQFLISRVLLRTSLSRYLETAPQEWRFTTDRYGRPRLDPQFQGVKLDYNLSHTRGLVACAITTSRRVGVDAEDCRRERVPLEIARAYFSAVEAKTLSSLSPAMQPERFFENWTLKESFAKADGRGLALPLDLFSFDLSLPGAVSMTLDPSLNGDSSLWEFWLLRPSDSHFVAVCAERGRTNVPRLLVRRMVPLRSEELCASPVVRRSHQITHERP